MPTPVPTELVEAAQKGGSLEVERPLEAIWPDAYRLAYSVLGVRPAAEDAAQRLDVPYCRACA